jgi:hypothetical protein
MKDGEAEKPEALVESIVRRLVGGIIHWPKDLRIQIVTCGTIMEVGMEVRESDVQLVVGSAAQNMSAISRICREFGHYFGLRIVATLHAPEKRPGVRFPIAPFKPNGNWDSREMVGLIRDVFALMGWNEIRIRQKKKVNTHILTIDQDIPRDLRLAVQVMFHAIGKAGGARVHIEFSDQYGQRQREKRQEARSEAY